MYRASVVIFVLVLLPILVGLGIWQYRRYQDQLTIEAQVQARRSSPVTIAQLQALSDPRFYPLTLTGHYDNSRYFLLDNRIWQGRVGFHVLMPFTASTEETVLVDRGWTPGFSDRSRLPAASAIDGQVTISGQSWYPAGKAFLLDQDPWSTGWPKVIQAIDQARMGSSLDITLPPWLLILDQHQPGSLQRNFAPTNRSPSRHLGYAVQWFTMALALAGLGIWAYRQGSNGQGQSE